ncbi:MAG TPA: hypothetical protein VFG39_07665 [Balneolaceae bacterium]|nr:hypothetical protein [Balneolaceae bacterium]
MVKLHRFLFLTAFLLAVSHIPLQAQHSFGVIWDIPENPQTAINQLRQFQKMGITAIEVKELPLPVVWEQINQSGLKVYGNLNIQFPLAQTFAEPDSLFIQKIERRASAYLSQPSVQALGLFEFGPVPKSEFINAVEPFVNQLKQLSDVKIYFVSSRISSQADNLTDFIIYFEHITPKNIHSFSLPASPVIAGYQFSVSADLTDFFAPFYAFLKATPAGPQKTIFIDSDWLFSILDKYPDFDQKLHAFATESDAVFPIPDETLPRQNDTSVPILVLLSVWGMMALLYSSDPIYRRSLFRYFTGHKFFVKDIFDRHLRSPWPAIIITLQNALLLAAGTFATFEALFSPLGEAAFYHHFPALSILGEGPFSLFTWAFFAALALSFLAITWLSVFHKNLNSITQTATLFAWPLQLNIILITIALVIFAAQGGGFLVFIFNLMAFLVFLFAFILTSFDASRFSKKPKLYILGTSGLYLILWGALITWALTQKIFWDVISLSLSLG